MDYSHKLEIKSTLSSLPTCFLSLFTIPTSVANKNENCKGNSRMG